MTADPDFDELSADVDPAERERLRRVHDMLVVAGPPPELTPQMEAGPTLAMTIGGRGTRRHVQRRVALLAAAIVVLLLAFLVGYITGNDNKVGGQLLKLQGTAAAPTRRPHCGSRTSIRRATGRWSSRRSACRSCPRRAITRCSSSGTGSRGRRAGRSS